MDGEHLANDEPEREGALMGGWNIDKVEKGKKPTLLEADKANELITALNALGNLSIEDGAVQKIVWGGNAVTLVIDKKPSGFHEKDIEVCEGGVIKTYTMLVKGPL